MDCPNCGVKINALGVKYCEICGTELSLIEESANQNYRNVLKTPSKRKRCC